MIGLDTNVLVRFLTADDPLQSPEAKRLVGSLTEAQPGFISLGVLVETHWVLRQTYHYKIEDIHGVLSSLLNVAEFVIDEADLVRAALATAAATGRELPDVIIAERGIKAGCQATYTFDKRVSELPGMELLG